MLETTNLVKWNGEFDFDQKIAILNWTLCQICERTPLSVFKSLPYNSFCNKCRLGKVKCLPSISHHIWRFKCHLNIP